ncbi:MAG: dehydrogenase, partial [Planctomycetota bacterium]|nr:dehydrogenase [Planctomycetota bacterium]
MMLDQPWTLRRLSLLVVLVVSFGPDAILTTATEVSAADAAAKALTAGTEKSTAPAVQDPELFRQVIRTTEALSPEEERQSFIVPPGFEVQLVAADPDIAKPLNMAFDTRGRLWITDSLEYPTPVPLDQKGRDSVKVLEDTNGDGHADRITTFADGLNIPMGLYPYKDGVVCFSIPDILFLRDTDSDGKADVRQKLYGPMGWERDTHGMCNAFTRGFDGWLYSCHGFNNHTTVSGSDGHEITMQSGNTFRMRLDGSRVEHFTHGQVNPFGMTLDPTGDLFNADCHTKPITLLLKDGCYESFGKPHDGLGFVPNVMDHLHGSTAIGGIAQYNATGFPEEYRGNTFGGNVMTSRVNRNALVLTGSSVRAEAKPDFLISSDPWFRPSDLQIGPDGALYIADFYNRIIGHYEVGLDHPGRDRRRGRIWRVIYRGDNPDSASKMDDLTQLSLKELVERLESPHLTVRSLATDRLVDDIGNACSETVRAVFLDAKRSPAARSHALWILHRLSELTLSELAQAVHPSSPTLLKTHGHRVLGELEPVPAEVLPWIVQGFSDDDGRVRRAAVSASTAHPTVATLQPLIALHSGTPDADPHLRHSIKMALRNHLEQPQMLQQLEEQPLTQLQRKLIADVCLAVKTPAAGEFLVRHIADIENADRSRLAEIMRTAAGRVSKESVERIAELAQSRFADDSEFQIELLAGIRSALPPSEKLPPAISAWLAKLIRNLLDRGP